MTSLTIPTPHGTGRTDPTPYPTAAQVADAVKTYGTGDQDVHALDGVSVDFATGRFTAIMGPSGSGKSTLHALHRRARHPDCRIRPHRRHRHLATSTTASSPSYGAIGSVSSSRRSTWCRR